MDGTVLRAAGSRHQVKEVDKLAKKVEVERIRLKEEPSEGSREQEKRVAKLEKREEALKYAHTHELFQVCVSEPSAHMMPQKEGGYAPAYNFQWSIEQEFGLVMGLEVITNPSDGGRLGHNLEGVRTVHSQQEVKAVGADSGYHNGHDIAKLIREGIKTAVAERGKRKAPGIAEAYQAEHFRYVEEEDVYICPKGQRLEKKERYGPGQIRYYGAPCASCPAARDCCQKGQIGQRGRAVTRSEYVKEAQENRGWLESDEGQRMRKQRSILAEGVTARLKQGFGARKLRCWGLEHVKSEGWLMATSLNVLVASGVWKPMPSPAYRLDV